MLKIPQYAKKNKTQKTQGAIDLWGGMKFIKKSCSYIKKGGM